MFQTKSRWRLVRRLTTVYAGTHLLEPGVDHFACREVELRPASPPAGRRPRAGHFPLDVDGDPLGDVPVTAGITRAALRVRAPVTPWSTVPPAAPPPEASGLAGPGVGGWSVSAWAGGRACGGENRGINMTTRLDRAPTCRASADLPGARRDARSGRVSATPR